MVHKGAGFLFPQFGKIFGKGMVSTLKNKDTHTVESVSRAKTRCTLKLYTPNDAQSTPVAVRIHNVAFSCYAGWSS